MKKALALLTACLLILLAGCALFDGGTDGTAAPTGSTPTAIFKSDEAIPKIDGSTALIPFAQELLKRTASYSTDAATSVTDAFTRTVGAYYNLAYADTSSEDYQSTILLVYEKPESAEYETPLEFYPIGVDALVFLANAKNPLENLKTQEIQDIYTGKITNWSKLGGKDKEIVAFQRNQGSGSQNLMEKLVMKGAAMAEAPSQLVPAAMAGLVDGLASYDNSADALGYSVYYYAKNMYALPDLKFLSVDGVAPANDTISSGQYPLTNDFYAVIRKDEPKNSPARKLLAWIKSDAGKECLTDTGYVAK
ncbi:MAG: substrate-binding domain-containing protein [Oscillospiraceae bacterium]|jgi:phosphate transport system substrate-binding protein|nr:substrate-binding domain-containing protein [Oscillospiraceae bacterium]